MQTDEQDHRHQRSEEDRQRQPRGEPGEQQPADARAPGAPRAPLGSPVRAVHAEDGPHRQHREGHVLGVVAHRQQGVLEQGGRRQGVQQRADRGRPDAEVPAQEAPDQEQAREHHREGHQLQRQVAGPEQLERGRPQVRDRRGPQGVVVAVEEGQRALGPVDVARQGPRGEQLVGGQRDLVEVGVEHQQAGDQVDRRRRQQRRVREPAGSGVRGGTQGIDPKPPVASAPARSRLPPRAQTLSSPGSCGSPWSAATFDSSPTP